MNPISVHRRRLAARASVFAMLPLLIAAPAAAQDAADLSAGQPQTVQDVADAEPGLTPAAADDSGYEEIVITAERREQRLQDVPISASVFSADDIARRGIEDVSDLQQVSPSITINTVNRSTFINIRGIGLSQSAPTQSPGVAFYIDGQLIPQDFFVGLSFYDVGTIEVLRGPQGTLTGQNSTGGAIYLRTPEPRYDDFSGYVEQTVGNFDAFRTIAAVNYGPNDNVALRIAGTHDERDSFSDNIGPSPSTPGNVNLDAIRANLALRSEDHRLQFNFRGEYFDSRSDNIAVKPFTGGLSTDPFTIDYDGITYFDLVGYRLSGEIRYDITDGVRIRAISSWQDGYTEDVADGDRTSTTPNPAARVAFGRTNLKNFINEVNLISTGSGPFNWVLGAFRLDGKVPVTLLRDNNSRVTFNRSNSTIVATADNRSQSLFGQANWFVTEELELIAGVRHSWDRQVWNQIVLPGPPVPPSQNVASSSEWTGRLGLNYHVSNYVTAYATASKGYKAGGANLGVNAASYLPETSYVYELGLKTEIIPRHLRVNGAIFRAEYQDLQFVSLLNGLPLTQNAARGEAWGAEIEVIAQWDALSFNAGGGWLDAQFARNVCINNTNNPAGTRASCPSTSLTQADELVPAGRVLPYSPEWTINAGAQYAFDLGGEVTLTPRVQWNYISDQITTPFPGARTNLSGRNLVDARLTLDIGERYRIEAYANNLFDNTYVASLIQNTSTANGGFIYGAPRQYGLRATVRFGDE
ncbi:MAG: TonB-dependent receptor [Allosphingosinicella sp.]